MAFGFTDWDGASGTIKPGSIKRASSSNDKVWGEENRTEIALPYGTFVAVNPEGGVMPLAEGTRIHGIVVRDIYGDAAPHNKQVNVGHFSHGDCVGALTVEDADFARGDTAYIVATGADAGKVTNEAAGNIDLGYWVEDVSAGNNCVAITLGYVQQTAAGV
ncbi:structural cement protein Gp24 [Citrobacter portucalensis]|uniref:structural cement protein Gp24 n=1 Tax=Citrobacter portucalensis TaxID=1639133 RepID=UPI0038969FE3